MSFHNRAVDQIQAVARFRCKVVEDPLPDASARPAVKAIICCRVWPVACRQVTPRHAGAQHIKDRVHNLTVVYPRALATLRQQRFEQRPFVIAEIKSHDPPPRTVNHVRPNYSMNYLGTDPSSVHRVSDVSVNSHLHSFISVGAIAGDAVNGVY